MFAKKISAGLIWLEIKNMQKKLPTPPSKYLMVCPLVHVYTFFVHGLGQQVCI